MLESWGKNISVEVVLDLSQKLRNYSISEYEKIKPQKSKVSVQHQECSGE